MQNDALVGNGHQPFRRPISRHRTASGESGLHEPAIVGDGVLDVPLALKKAPQKFPKLLRCLFIPFWVVRQAENIVHRHLIEIRQPNENIRGDIPLSQLVVAVYLLRTVQIFGELPLLQIPVLPQIPYALVHAITSGIRIPHCILLY